MDAADVIEKEAEPRTLLLATDVLSWTYLPPS